MTTELIAIQPAAVRAGISVQSLYNWLAKDQAAPSKMKHGRRVYFHLEEFDSWIAQRIKL